MIIKTGDNLKQEQFAAQLINQFNQIFKDEKVKLKLRPYEILSLGPDSGLIEMVKNATTLDNLKRQLNEKFKNNVSGIGEFFKIYHGENL